MPVVTSQLQLGNNANFSGGSSGFLADAPIGTVIKNAVYNTGYGASGAQTVSNSTSHYTINIGGTSNHAFNCSESGNVLSYTKISNTSHLRVGVQLPVYGTTMNNGCGVRIQASNNNGSSYHIMGELSEGTNDGWGHHGYAQPYHSGTVTFAVTTYDNSSERSNWYSRQGDCKFYIQARSWSSSDTYYWITYPGHNKYGFIYIEEIMYG